jgi:maleate isomerase
MLPQNAHNAASLLAKSTLWRAKLGLIVPSWNTVMEYEFQRIVPPGFSVHVSRIPHTQDTEHKLQHMLSLLLDGASLLAHAKVDAICFGCTGSGFVQEDAYRDAEAAAEVSSALGVPTITTSDSVALALRHLNVSRVAVASPYEPWLNAHLKRYLEARGFSITGIAGFGTQEHARCSPEDTLSLALGVVGPESQAIFISCTNFRTLEIIQPLEDATGLPVVTSTQASVWRLMAILGMTEGIAGAGRLLRRIGKGLGPGN